MNNFDINLSENQDIKAKFVSQNVFANMSMIIQDLSNHESGDYYDELMEFNCIVDLDGTIDDSNYTVVKNSTGGYEWVDYDDSENCSDEGFETEKKAMADCINQNDIDVQYLEILEYWSVSDYMSNKLREKGHAVIEMHGHNIWGRTTSGQAISLDNVVSAICHDMMS